MHACKVRRRVECDPSSEKKKHFCQGSYSTPETSSLDANPGSQDASAEVRPLDTFRLRSALTSQRQPSKQAVVPGRRVAVPAVAAELMLALKDPVLHPGAHDLHHLGVLATQLALLVHQSGDVVAHHLGAQGAHVPAGRRRRKGGKV